MGEDVTDMATTTSQLQAKLLALTGGQVDIMLDANTFKNSTQILREMAEAWEDMTDIERAAALELMGGKRQANVLSALIQNFDTVEEVIETSANSAGSALEENERYLDSIQGKIDQFNNAMQTMWSNTLDSDLVKWFVNAGTEIIKFIDKIGLLNTALIALATISMIKNKMGPIAFLGGISDIIRDVAGKVGGFIGSLTGMTAATSVYTAETLAASVANGTLSASEAANIATKNGLTLATTNLTAAEAAEMLTKTGMKQADALAIVDKLGLTSATSALTMETVKATMANAGYTPAQIAAANAALFGAGANKTLAASFGALWTAIWPILAVMAGVAVIWGAVKLIDHLVVTTEELTEELNDLKTELQDIQSELDSVNSELETTNERMAELLAKDSLTFTEKEELDNLRKQNDELQRRIDLLDLEREQKAREASQTFNQVMEKDIGFDFWGGKGETWKNGKKQPIEYTAVFDKQGNEKYIGRDASWDTFWNLVWYEAIGGGSREFLSETEYLDKQMSNYGNASAEEKEEIEAVINGKLDEWKKAAGDLDYGVDEETDEWLDFIYNYQDKWAITSGGKNAETNAITRIFNKDENAEISNSIDEYVEALRKGDTNAKFSIENIIKNNHALVEDLEASGLSADSAVDYFTSFASELEFATLEGKIQEVSKAAADFETLIKGGVFQVDGVDTGLTGLFDKEGKIIQTKLSQVFQGTSDQTREDITRLLEGSYDQIKNGTVDVERLLSGFALKTTQQVLEIQNKVLGEQNIELFPNLKDEIDGIIDKFSEFSAAVGSVVDALDTLEQARAEEAYSGSISIETLENLMKYTDDYAQLVEIDETGAIRLAADAEQILIEQRLQKIKTDAAAAVQTAQSNLAQAEYNAKAVNETGPVQEALTSATDALAGAWAYLGSLLGDVTGGNFGGMFERASTAYGKVTAGREEKRAQVNVSVEDAEEALARALDQQKIANALTPDNVKSKHSADEASGGNATKEDAEKDLIEDGWEKLLSEYENKLALLSNERDLIQAEIDKAEAQGRQASSKYYDDLIRSSTAEKNLLIEKKKALEDYLEKNKDNVDQDTWTEMNNEINETAVAIKECTINLLEYYDALEEWDSHYFEQAMDDVSRLGEEIEFVQGLLEDEDVADENGNWTAAGITRLGLYTNEMERAAASAESYKQQIGDVAGSWADYQKLLENATDANEDGVIDVEDIPTEELNKLYDTYGYVITSEEEFKEKSDELTDSMYSEIDAYNTAKDGIIEMNEARIDAIKEGIEKEIEAYEDLIDAKKEELDAERDLHDFRENIKDQTKDIASLERRIAALSGSSAASDIAERRKLEAQLLEAKEGLNDTYYGHSRDAQSAALDEEAEAYTLSKERYIEHLEEQLKDTQTLIENSIMDVMLNADTVYTELNELADLYGIDLSDSLTLPWKNASTQATAWKNELRDSMTSGEYASLIGEGGAVTAFANGVATKLTGSWSKAQTAAKNYAGYLTGAELKNRFTSTLTGFGNQIQTIIDKWNGVKKAADDAYAAQTRKVTVGGTGSGNTGGSSGGGSGGGGGGNSGPYPTPEVTHLQRILNQFFSAKLGLSGIYDAATKSAVANMQSMLSITPSGLYDKKTKDAMQKWLNQRPVGSWFKQMGFGVPAAMYAKGTTGTTRDEWAITDEPQFGDELVLVPGKDGNLSFMRKGTGVIPADLTQKLFELSQIPVSDLMSKSLTAIVPNITKNDFKNEFNFESLVHVDTVDSDTLPKLEKMVDKKIDDFSRALNYSLKKFAR